MKPLLLSILFLACIQPGISAQTMYTYTISPDSTNGFQGNINSFFPANVDSTSVDLIIADWTNGGTSSFYRCYLKFDLSGLPAGAVIDSAFLSLYADVNSVFGAAGSPTFGNANESKIFRVAGSWTKAALSWVNQPALAADSVILAQSINAQENYLRTDVSNMVRNMATLGNNGFLIRHTQETSHYNSMIFNSPYARGTKYAQRPSLLVKYDIPCAAIPTAPTYTTSSPVSICSGGTQTIVSTDPNGTSGISYQWQQSAASTGPWSNITGATSLSYTTPALSTTTYYRLVDSCANSHLENVSTVFTVNVLTTPTISVQPVDKTICSGANTSFSLTAGGGGLNYQWQVNTGSGFTTLSSGGVYTVNANTLNITGTLASMNGYIYQCVVSNICGSPLSSGTATLHVNGVPAISTQPANSVTCPGNNATFSVAATGAGLTYVWKENGIALGTGGIYTGVTSPTLTITGATLAMNGRVYTCVVSGTCLPAVTTTGATLTVAIFTANATSIGATSFCSGASVELDANTITSANYQWQLNGGNIGGATTSTYFANVIGDYSVVISTPNGCSATSSPVYIDVVPAPATPAITSTARDTVCAGTPLTLQATPVPGLFYQWALNGVNIPNAISINYLVPVSGSGSYTVSVINSYGCSDTSTPVSVLINTPPAPITITPEGLTSICLGSSVTLTSDAPTGLTYQWYDNNNLIVGALQGSYNAPDSGNYVLVITDGNGCSTRSIPYHIVLDIVSPSIQLYNDMLCTEVYVSYQWFLDGNAIPGAISTCYVPAQNGHYSVWTTDDIGCGGMSNYIDVEDLAVNNVSKANSFRIYPNPATSVIHIDPPVKVNVTISDMEGKQILSYTNPKDIDISQLASGIYMIHFYDENQLILHTEKLVKTNW